MSLHLAGGVGGSSIGSRTVGGSGSSEGAWGNRCADDVGSRVILGCAERLSSICLDGSAGDTAV